MTISRHTRQRQQVLMTVKSSAEGLTADMVFQRVRKLVPRVGRATIYRNLELLVERGELYRFEGDDGTRQYFGHVFHQAVFRCQRCGKQRQLPSQTLHRYVDPKMFGDQTVFLSRLTAQGLCAVCARAVRQPGVRV